MSDLNYRQSRNDRIRREGHIPIPFWMVFVRRLPFEPIVATSTAHTVNIVAMVMGQIEHSAKPVPVESACSFFSLYVTIVQARGCRPRPAEMCLDYSISATMHPSIVPLRCRVLVSG